MNRALLVVAVIGLSISLMVLLIHGAPPSLDRPAIGRLVSSAPTPVPPLRFTDGDGRTLTLGDFAGRVVLLNLWATWCGPCVRELPSLDRLQATLGSPRFQVVALAEDHGGTATVLPFLQQRQIRALAAYLDTPGAAVGVFGIPGLPTSILIDRNGQEVGRLVGGTNWDEGSARRVVEELVKEP